MVSQDQSNPFSPLYPLLLMGILAVGLALRLTGVAWDDLHHYHPDERYISWVATSIEWTGHEQWRDLLSPQRSRFNPYYWPAGETTKGIVVPQDENRNFAYGHLPLYVGVAVGHWLMALPEAWQTAAAEAPPLWRLLLTPSTQLEFDYLTVVGRVVTALFDVGSIWLIYRLGRRLFAPIVGVIAAGLLALNVMHIQLAHFFISDTILTFFVLLTLVSLVEGLAAQQAGQTARVRWWLSAAATAAGLAIGSKFSAVLLALPVLLTLFLIDGRRWWRSALLFGFTTVVAFALTNPFALLDFTCPPETAEVAGVSLTVSNCYLLNIARESTMVRGGQSFPFTRQYDETAPFVYPILNQLRWGMGWPLGIMAFGGSAVAVVVFLSQAMRSAGSGRLREAALTQQGMWVVLAWLVPFFLSTASFQVKFMRYLQPVTPLLLLLGVWALWRLGRPWFQAGAALVGISTALYAAAFVGIYGQPHPWVSASVWMYEHVPAGQAVVVELWDETLPTNLQSRQPDWNRRIYRLLEVNWLSRPFARDDQAKLQANLEQLAAADYWIVASNRSYGVVSRLPNTYPVSQSVYARLFAGELGYEPVFVASRPLTLGPWSWLPDHFDAVGLQPPLLVAEHLTQPGRWIGPPADESFTVYDQPLVMIFENTGRLTAAEMAARVAD